MAIIDAIGVERVDLCGVSIGGMTALWVALHAPDRVRRVVLANTAAQIGDVGMWSARIKTVRTDGFGALADATMTRWFTPEFRAARPEVVARFHSTIAQSDADGYAGCCAALRDADLRELARGRLSRPWWSPDATIRQRRRRRADGWRSRFAARNWWNSMPRISRTSSGPTSSMRRS